VVEGKSFMAKKIRLILMVILLAVFLGSGWVIFTNLHQYQEERQYYDQTSEKYVRQIEHTFAEKEEDGLPEGGEEETAVREVPIEVDFDELLAANSDVVGWIYCEDTIINYPVLQGEDNSYYLHHTLDGTYVRTGSIFVDGNNRRDFQDANTIIYGHHTKDVFMFATLDYWAEQEYYEEHPVIWLLTPTQNYKIVLFSGYHTSAYSDTYQIFSEPGEALEEYLEVCRAQSDFQADVELDENARYVLLSTCAYIFTDARYVLHGMLVPVDEE